MERLITNNLLKARANKLFHYSPYAFIKSIPLHLQLEQIVLPKLHTIPQQTIDIDGAIHLFYIEQLEWDSSYFRKSIARLHGVLYDHQNESLLVKAIHTFISTVQYEYLYIEIPCEDMLLIQALTQNGFKLIETRLTYYNDRLSAFNQPRFAVRKGTVDDIQNLKQVAREMRNELDRFHADKVFSNEEADEFLATYIENSIHGFADMVLVPNEKGVPSDSFLTAKYLKEDWTKLGVPVSKMVLSAVSAKTNKGWYKKLVTEMTYTLRDYGAECIFMNTQAGNRAVIHVWESLGYAYGATHHILSKTFNT